MRAILIGLAAVLAGGGIAAAALYVSGQDKTATTTTIKAAGQATTATVTTTSTSASTSIPAATNTNSRPASLTKARAMAIVERQGYDVTDPSTFIRGRTLEVLVGTGMGSTDGTSQRAFFFVGNRYIGNDTSEPSAGIRVGYQTGTEVALDYALYKPDDPQCCPTAGSATVRYDWAGSQLVPKDPIPPRSFSAPRSRR